MTSSSHGWKQPPFTEVMFHWIGWSELVWLISVCLAHASVVGWWLGLKARYEMASHMSFSWQVVSTSSINRLVIGCSLSVKNSYFPASARVLLGKASHKVNPYSRDREIDSTSWWEGGDCGHFCIVAEIDPIWSKKLDKWPSAERDGGRTKE